MTCASMARPRWPSGRNAVPGSRDAGGDGHGQGGARLPAGEPRHARSRRPRRRGGRAGARHRALLERSTVPSSPAASSSGSRSAPPSPDARGCSCSTSRPRSLTRSPATSCSALLRRLNEEWGTTILLAEHRLERCLGAADRVIALRVSGEIVCDAAPSDFLEWAHDAAPALETPGATLIAGLGLHPAPAGVKQARATLRRRPAARARGTPAARARRGPAWRRAPSRRAGQPALRINRLARASRRAGDPRRGLMSTWHPASGSSCWGETAPASRRCCATPRVCSSRRAGSVERSTAASPCCCRTPATTSSTTASATSSTPRSPLPVSRTRAAPPSRLLRR
jgi:hypothetical protein